MQTSVHVSIDPTDSTVAVALCSVPEPGVCGVCADTLVDNLTVQEMLLYTAEMKLEMGVGMAEKRARVEALLRQLALEPCRNVRIGGSMQRGISGASCCCAPCCLPSTTGRGSLQCFYLASIAAMGILSASAMLWRLASSSDGHR